MPLTLSKIHGIGQFASEQFPKARYSQDCHRVFTTDGNVVIGVPVDGNSVPNVTFPAKMMEELCGLQLGESVVGKSDKSKVYIGGSKSSIGDDPNFPDVGNVFPDSRPQLVVAFSPASLRKIGEYAESNCESGEPIYLGIPHDPPSPSSEGLQRTTQPVLFFCVAEDKAGNKLVSGVILPHTIDDADYKRVSGLVDAARKPKSIAKSPDPRDYKVEHHIKSLRAAGYTIIKPGEAVQQQTRKTAEPKIAEPKAARRMNPKSIAAVELLRQHALDGELDKFDELIEFGVDSGRLDSDGNHLLVHVAAISPVDVLEHVITACPKLVNKCDSQCWTPIMYAAVNESLESVELLLKHGAITAVEIAGQSMQEILASEGVQQSIMDVLFPVKKPATTQKKTVAKKK